MAAILDVCGIERLRFGGFHSLAFHLADPDRVGGAAVQARARLHEPRTMEPDGRDDGP
jgi:hypothetical protein